MQVEKREPSGSSFLSADVVMLYGRFATHLARWPGERNGRKRSSTGQRKTSASSTRTCGDGDLEFHARTGS